MKTEDEETQEFRNIVAAVDRAASQVIEHTDSVLIVVTKATGRGARTLRYYKALGNLYASVAAAEEWMDNTRAYEPEIPDLDGE